MTDLFLDAEEQKQKEVEKELKNTHPIAPVSYTHLTLPTNREV